MHPINLSDTESLSHALATPLTVILLSLEIVLKSKSLPRHNRRQLKMALASARKIKHLINEMRAQKSLHYR